MDRVRVILADDFADFLAVATRILEPEFEIVTTVRDGRSLIAEAARLKPDVVITDISMPVMTGIQAVRYLRATSFPAKIVFLTVHEHMDYVHSALAAGANAYVVKHRLASDLLVALREALAGRSFISPLLATELRA